VSELLQVDRTSKGKIEWQRIAAVWADRATELSQEVARLEATLELAHGDWDRGFEVGHAAGYALAEKRHAAEGDPQ